MSLPRSVSIVVGLAYLMAALALGALARAALGSPFDWIATLAVALVATALLGAFAPLRRMVLRARVARRILQVLAGRPGPSYVDTLIVSYLVRGLPADTSLAELEPDARRAVEDLRLEVEEACERLVVRGLLEPWTETFHFRATGPTDCVTPGLYRLTEAGARALRALRERAATQRAGA